jgi:glycosyltransferase involved in cell wall biosynthesis
MRREQVEYEPATERSWSRPFYLVAGTLLRAAGHALALGRTAAAPLPRSIRALFVKHLIGRAVSSAGNGAVRVSVAVVRGATRIAVAGTRVVLDRFAWPSRSWAYYRQTWRIVTTELPPPDIVHANDLDTLLVGAAISRRYRVPLVYDAQELYTGLHTLPAWYRVILRLQEFVLLRFVDRVTVVNDAIGAVMERRYLRKVDSVILNCPPYEGDMSRRPGESLRDRLSLPSDCSLLLYSGGLSPQRGLENTVRALTNLSEAVLVLLGDGALKPDLEQLAAREGVRDRVFFLDFVPHQDVPSLIRSADVGVIPYENVGVNHYLCSPSKLFHYVMAEVPVACSDFPFLRSVVRDEALGVVFDPHDPASIAAAVHGLVSDPAHYARVKVNLAIAKKHYSWEVQEARFLEVYRSVMPLSKPFTPGLGAGATGLASEHTYGRVPVGGAGRKGIA